VTPRLEEAFRLVSESIDEYLNGSFCPADEALNFIMTSVESMQDQLRWRLQSTERAPDELFVQYRSTLQSDFHAHGHCLGSELKPTDEWMPVPE
jgi:hypothetical protein